MMMSDLTLGVVLGLIAGLLLGMLLVSQELPTTTRALAALTPPLCPGERAPWR